MVVRQPLQYSLRVLVLLTIIVAAALAVGRDFYLSMESGHERALERWSFAPMIGWLALAALYRRPDLGDLLFIHGLLPALALAVIAIVGLSSLSDRVHPAFWHEFPLFSYWLLYAACLVGTGVGLAYWGWLSIIGDTAVPAASTKDARGNT